MATDTERAIRLHLSYFTEHEQKAVLFICERLSKGRQKYGPLNPHDGRDWATEAAEELADYYVYAAAHAMKEASGD